MGPQLLIDKSALQALSKEEAMFMQIHYFLVWTPILFIEILGDLRKNKNNDIEASRREILKTVSKISSGESCFTADYRILLQASLLGYDVRMDYRPVLLGGKEIVTKNGQRGFFFDEEPEYGAFRRWIKGEFLEAEKLLSEYWRRFTHSIDLIQRQKVFSTATRVNNFKDLIKISENILNDPSRQFEILQYLLSEAGFSNSIRNSIFSRWLNNGMISLNRFSPYAYYCAKVFISFYLGIANGLIGRRPTNRIDLEYILYLPFCRIFVSSDKFLRDFAPYFLDVNQDFVWGAELKLDLQRITQHWNSLTNVQKEEYRKKYGCYPPDLEGSITNQLWKKYISPRNQYKGEIEITPEREKEIMRQIGPIIDAIKQLKEN